MPNARLRDFDVVAASGANESASLDSECELVKGVVLYADRITLVSPQLNSIRQLVEDTASWVSLHASEKDEGALEVIPIYHRIRKGYGATLEEWELLEERIESVERLIARVNAESGELLRDFLGSELRVAIDMGVLRLEELATHSTATIPLEAAMWRRFEQLILEDAAVVPIFDPWASLQLEFRAGGGIAAPTPDQRELEITRYIFAEIPAFPEAGMDELLDVRARLARPRMRLRAALAAASLEVSAEDKPTASVAEAARSIFRREVTPALLELDETLADLGARATLQRARGAAATSVGIAAAGYLSFSKLIAGAIVPAGAAAGAEMKYRDEIRRRRFSSNYFFVWRANQLLSR